MGLTKVCAAVILIVSPVVTLAGDWHYQKDHDEMRNTDNRWATLASTNAVNLPFPYNGGSKLFLSLRSMPKKNGNDAYFKISKGQMNCSYRGCKIPMKFDDGAIVQLSAVSAQGGDTSLLFLTDYNGFLKRLRSAKKLIIEIHLWRQGSEQFTFDTTGLEWK